MLFAPKLLAALCKMILLHLKIATIGVWGKCIMSLLQNYNIVFQVRLVAAA